MPNPLTKSPSRIAALLLLMIALILIGYGISVQVEIAIAAMLIIADTADLLERKPDGTQ